MVGEVKEFICGLAKGVNAYTGLQFLWIVELYYLGINVFFIYRDKISSVLNKIFGWEVSFPLPDQVEYYNNALLEFLSTYKYTFAALGVVLIFLGIFFKFFSYSFLDHYKNIRYTSYGLYSGEWTLIICITYVIFDKFPIAYLFFAPIVSAFHWLRIHSPTLVMDFLEKQSMK